MISEDKSSAMLTQLVRADTNTYNYDGIPNNELFQDNIAQQAAFDAYDHALDVYNQKYQQYFSIDEPKGQQIHVILKQIRDEALDTYDYCLDVPNQRIRNKLKNLIMNKQKSIIKVNNQLNEAKNVEILRDCSSALMQNLELKKYSAENPKLLTQDLNNMINKYNNKAQGPHKCEVLSIFLTNFNPMVLKSYTQTTKNNISKSLEQAGALNQLDYNNEQTIQILQQKIKNMQQQAAPIGNYNNIEMQQFQNQLRMQNDTMRRQLQMINQNKNGTKCCLLF